MIKFEDNKKYKFSRYKFLKVETGYSDERIDRMKKGNNWWDEADGELINPTSESIGLYKNMIIMPVWCKEA